MRHRIEKKIIKIERYVDLLRSMQDDCKEKFLDDPIYEGALLHYLYLVSDSCIAVAEMVIRHKDFERAESYHEAIDVGNTALSPLLLPTVSPASLHSEIFWHMIMKKWIILSFVKKFRVNSTKLKLISSIFVRL